MTRPVLWATEASRDTLEILRHIAEDDPDVAERIVDLIEAAGDRLGNIADRPPRTRRRHFRKIPYSPSLDPLLRRR